MSMVKDYGVQIKEFEAASGLRRTSIRFYERKELLALATTLPGNGYREYGPDPLARARTIRLARSLGFFDP